MGDLLLRILIRRVNLDKHNYFPMWKSEISLNLAPFIIHIVQSAEKTVLYCVLLNAHYLLASYHARRQPLRSAPVFHLPTATPISYMQYKNKAKYSPPASRKSLRWNGCSGAVYGGCLLSGGLEGCYWWEVQHARVTLLHTDRTLKQLRVACRECTCTVFCGCCDNILHLFTGDLNMPGVCKHVKGYCLSFVLVEQMLTGWLTKTSH
jgi:hypothetical protein